MRLTLTNQKKVNLVTDSWSKLSIEELEAIHSRMKSPRNKRKILLFISSKLSQN